MVASLSAGLTRRTLLAAAAAACATPPTAGAIGVYTPHEIEQQYAQRVTRRLELPRNEHDLYASMAELQLYAEQRRLLEPQYLLVVDNNPHVQAALLLWRLWAGSYRLLGASPVSTGGPVRPDHLETPTGIFEQAGAGGPRVYDFGWQRTRNASGRGPLVPMRLQAIAADARAERRLGSACSNGSIVLPASLASFIDDFGLLGGAAPRSASSERIPLPYSGRHLLVIDSERIERPDWSPLPASAVARR